jgi:putative oxidoreductase
MRFTTTLQTIKHALDTTRAIDWIAPLALRAYLAPVFWMAGMNKLADFQGTVDWFGADGLGLPFPQVMATLATGAELGGAVSLALGLGLRWLCIPMMVTMIVAMATVHWQNGWLAIAEDMGPFANHRTMAAAEQLAKAKEILMQHGDYDQLTEYGSLAILNNGIEFAVTYFVMLLTLFFSGAGRWISLDFWIARWLKASTSEKPA